MKEFKNFKRMMTLVVMVLFSIISVFAQTVKTHVVERGETLASIAEKYSVTKEDIVKLNPDAAQFIYVGMELKIPEVLIANSNQNQLRSTARNVVESTTINEVGYKSNVPDSEYNSFLREGHDIYLGYQSDAKVYGLGVNMDFGKYFAYHADFWSNLKFGKNDNTCMNTKIGLGFKQRFCFNENVMIGIRAYPYIGLNGYTALNEKNARDFKTEFAYGAMAEAMAGIKLFRNKKGNDVYLSIGYAIDAPKFKTQGIFDSGMLLIGYSLIY